MTFRNAIIAATIMVALLTFLLWNRIPGPRPIRAAGRLGLMLLGQFLAVTALLVTLNISYGGLIVSWSDLLGRQSAAGAHMSGQAGRRALHPVPEAASRLLTSGRRCTAAG